MSAAFSYLFLILVCASWISLLLALFSVEFLKLLWQEIFLAFNLALAIYFLGLFSKWWWYMFSAPWTKMRSIWAFFSSLTARLASLPLFLVSQKVVLDFSEPGIPLVGTEKFQIKVAVPCSGLESLVLFSSFFLFVLFLQRKRVYFKKALLAFLPGAVGMFLLNVLRVFIAVLLGAYVGSDWAYQAFHNNISWVVFIGYFFLFWHFAFPRIRR